MTATELLAATGNAYRVDCYESGNRRRRLRTYYIRAASALDAELKAQRLSGRRCCDARPWNPMSERSNWGWIQQINHGGSVNESHQ